jgi:HEPN domain-containing protein
LLYYRQGEPGDVRTSHLCHTQSTKELRAIARARLRDAQVLLRAKRFDAAWYLCGYAIELALKARICRTLKWPGFPESAQDFKGLQSVKTHDLEILLRFSGIEDRVKARRIAEWNVVRDWNPERRYQANRLSTAQQAAGMVKCVERVLEIL